ncbi:hypothetical protein P4S65_08825 [Pseudoalteromonas sp. B131b]|uniref:hypothetical protein n=1 Tax=unclassified Pseudoalteromonas TaxID=194690 RepID=UPI0027B1F702|nr:hypothetical protein [Pseudoalteromonas sp. 20-92]MDQ2043037.1 hypothetical protein [Pseudoalteromonas sp. 20-92]
MQDKFESLIKQLEIAIDNENLELATKLDKQLLENMNSMDKALLNENIVYLQSLVERHRFIVNKVDVSKKQVHKNITQFNKNQKNLKKYTHV